MIRIRKLTDYGIVLLTYFEGGARRPCARRASWLRRRIFRYLP